MIEFFLYFEDFALELLWYFLGALEMVTDELIALCLVFASFLEEFVHFYFLRIKILA